MTTTLRIKQGDSISWSCAWRDSDGAAVDLTGYTLESEMRLALDRSLLASLTVTMADQTASPGVFEITLADSTSLPIGVHLVDIRVTDPSARSFSTETWQVTIEKSVTVR